MALKKRYSLQIVLLHDTNENDKYQNLGKMFIIADANISCRTFVMSAKKSIDIKWGNQHQLSYALNANEQQNGLKLFIRSSNDEEDLPNIQEKCCEIVDFNEQIKNYVVNNFDEVIIFFFRIRSKPMIPHNNHNSKAKAQGIRIVYFDNKGVIKETFEQMSEIETAINDFLSSQNLNINDCMFDLFGTAGFRYCTLPTELDSNCNQELLNILKVCKDKTLYISPRWIDHKDAFILPFRASDSENENKSNQKNDTVYQTIPSTLRLSADWMPYIAQTRKGMTSFLSCLYVITMNNIKHKDNVLGKIRYLTQNKFPPFLLSLKILLENRCLQLTKHHKAVISNSFYFLFRMIVPKKICNDNSKIFQYSHIIFSYILAHVQSASGHTFKQFEKYKSKQLKDPLHPLNAVTNDSLIKILAKTYPNCDEVFIWDQQSVEYKDNDNDIKMNDDVDEVWNESKWSVLKNSIGNDAQNKIMRIVPTLSLKSLSCSSVALSLDNNGDLCALCGSVKDDKNTRQFYCPLQRNIYQCDLDELAKTIKNLDLNMNQLTGYVDDGDVVDDRQPLEAIMVVFDRSLSMNDPFFGNFEMSRLAVVKQYFDAFLNRSKAYDYANHIGLILFGSKIETTCNISPLYETFRDKINEIDVEGRTALRDAMKEAAKQLSKWKIQYSNRRNCALRIIALTDGKDNRSVTKEDELLYELSSAKITVDAIMIGKHNKSLHSICLHSGGYVFYPKTFRDGLRIFELETFLSITQRGDLVERKRTSASKSTFNFYESNVDICDEFQVPKGKVMQHLNVPTISLKSKVEKIEHEGKEEKYNASSPMKTRKVIREMAQIMNDPHPFWNIFVDDKDIFFWKLLLSGPPQSPYEGGTFLLYLDLSGDYPEKAPNMRFVTPIKHVNINSYGRICHSIFDRNYNPDVKIRHILDQVYGLLINPDWDDPLDSVLRQEYADNPQLFRRSVTAHVQQYAMNKTREEMRRRLSGQREKRNFGAMNHGDAGHTDSTNYAKKRRLN